MFGSDFSQVFSVGTKVETQVPIEVDSEPIPVGAVGEVTSMPSIPQGVYHVRFEDGRELPLFRAQLAPHSDTDTEVGMALVSSAPIFAEYGTYIQFRGVVGSQAHGLATSTSDVDRRGWYLPPADAHWSLDGVPEQLTHSSSSDVYWELEKFIRLALKANPTVLECLYTPLVEYASPLAQELLAMRASFLSKLAYQSYKGYVQAQFKKLRSKQASTGTIHWQHAMHLIRLLITGITLLESGELQVQVEHFRDRLLLIKKGELDWQQVYQWQVDLHRQLDTAYELTYLPANPDYAAANRFLLQARRSMVDAEL